MQFAHPNFLWTLLVLVPLVVWYVLKQRRLHATLSLSTTSPFAKLPRTWKQYLAPPLVRAPTGYARLSYNSDGASAVAR